MCSILHQRVLLCSYCLDHWMQDFRKSQEPTVRKLKEPILDEITNALVQRYGLNFTRQDMSSLWFLCKEVIISTLLYFRISFLFLLLYKLL